MRVAVLFLLLVPAVLAQKRAVTLQALEEISRMTPQGPGNPVAWAPDGTRFVYRQGRKLVVYDPASKSSQDLTETAGMEDAAVKPAKAEPEPFG